LKAILKLSGNALSWALITDCNQAGLRFLGVTSKTEVPPHLDYYFTEYSFESFKETLIALAEGSTQWAGEISVRSLKDEPMELTLQLAVVPGHEDDLSKVLVSVLDITKSKEVEKIMLLKEERLRQIIDLVPHLIFARDMEGVLFWLTVLWLRFMGQRWRISSEKKDEDFAKSLEEVRRFHEDDLEVIRSGKPKFIAQEPSPTLKSDQASFDNPRYHSRLQGLIPLVFWE